MNLYDGLGSEIGDEFRALPSEVQGIENNLSIANMDFAEFAGGLIAEAYSAAFDRGG